MLGATKPRLGSEVSPIIAQTWNLAETRGFNAPHALEYELLNFSDSSVNEAP
jgi:hypothetical protein